MSTLVLPSTPPPQMKDSVQAALVHIADRYAPEANAAWLLAPADLPQLSPRVIDQVLAADSGPASIRLSSPASRGNADIRFDFPGRCTRRSSGWVPNRVSTHCSSNSPSRKSRPNEPADELDIDLPRRLSAPSGPAATHRSRRTTNRNTASSRRSPRPPSALPQRGSGWTSSAQSI